METEEGGVPKKERGDDDFGQLRLLCGSPQADVVYLSGLQYWRGFCEPVNCGPQSMDILEVNCGVGAQVVLAAEGNPQRAALPHHVGGGD